MNLAMAQVFYQGNFFQIVYDYIYNFMSKKKSIDFQIGFSDSQIISFNSKGNDLLIYLESWNAKILKFKFVDNIFFLIYNSWDIADICWVDNSPLFEKAMKIIYEEIPSRHPYRLVQFFDNDGNATAEIGCKDLFITIEPNLVP
jgi:hypothetical protein